MEHVQVVGFGTSTSQTLGLPAGTATIGNVGIVAGTAAVGAVTLSAGTANAGFIVSTAQADVFRYGAVSTAIQYASVALTSSAANAVIVTSVTAKRIVLLAAALGGSPAMTVQFFSAATTKSGPMSIAAGGQINMGFNQAGWVICNSAESLTVTPSVSGNLGGVVTFIVV